jgi:hypothetical protein
MDILPGRIKRIIDDCFNYLGYPRDFTAASILGATSIAIGRTHKIQYQWQETSCLYMAIVAPPGTAKSHPLKFALTPIIDKNKQAIRDYNRAQELLAQAGQVSGKLRDRQCLFSDFTIEALVKAVQLNPRGISVYIDELRAWFQNFNRYNSGSEQEFWLQNWSGTPLAVTRLTRKAFLDWPAISVVGTIQPSLLEDIGKGGRGQNGFTERILYVFPDQVPVIMLKKRYERSDTYDILMKNYRPIINQILEYDLLIEGGGDEDDQPHEVYFCPEADDLITEYINDLKVRMDRITNEYLRNVYSKLQTYVIRFCLILNRLDYACAYQDNREFPPEDLRTISLPQADRACVLAEWFLKHALKSNSIVNAEDPLNRLSMDKKNFYKSLPFGKPFTITEAETKARSEEHTSELQSRSSS